MITTFVSLEDKIADRLLAAFLRQRIEPALFPSAIAFRQVRTAYVWDGRHEAIEEIIALRKKTLGQPLFVAECDIKSFFDSIGHQVLLRELGLLAGNVGIDPRVIAGVKSLLKNFSFPRNVLGDSRIQTILSREKRCIPWPDRGAHSLAQFYGRPKRCGLGLPQGAALSSVLANVLLHRADQALEGIRAGLPGETLIYRYCDDLLIVSTSRIACQRAFDAYRRTLGELKLPAHPPKLWRKAKEFFHTKTKATYEWVADAKGRPNASNWVQFLGYEINAGGETRLRKSSLEKHRKSLLEEVERLVELRSFYPFRRSPEATVASINGRLTAKGVGKNHANSRPQQCWAAGFVALQNSRQNDTQLRALDRHRKDLSKRLRPALNLPGGADPFNLQGYRRSYAGRLSRNDTQSPIGG